MDTQNIIKQLKCFISDCNKLYTDIQDKTKIWNNNKIHIIKEFLENIKTIKPNSDVYMLKKTEFIKKMEILDNGYFKSKLYKDFSKCAIKNCYECTNKNLDFLLSQMPEVKYKKPKIYTNIDYINIMMLYHRKMGIIKIADNPEIAKLIISLKK